MKLQIKLDYTRKGGGDIEPECQYLATPSLIASHTYKPLVVNLYSILLT